MYSPQARSPKTGFPENFTRQGSLRKVIPPQYKENLFGRQNEDLNKLYKTFHQEYAILAEYKMIQSENIQGVYVIPSREDPFVWFGVIFIRSGLYEDGIFRFNIILDENFPESEHPKVLITSDVYHPVIHQESKELHLLDAFPTWNKSEQHIWQILKYLQWIFYNLPASIAHSVNKKAADLYRNQPEAFKEKVRELVNLSQEKIYDEPQCDDKHYIIFDRYNPPIHEQAKSAMLIQHQEDTPKLGHSWVLPGHFKPLERPPTPESGNES